MPVGSGRGAQARLVRHGMALQIVHDDIVGDVAAGGREVAPRPETLPPIAFADVLELPLDLVRGAALGPGRRCLMFSQLELPDGTKTRSVNGSAIQKSLGSGLIDRART